MDVLNHDECPDAPTASSQWWRWPLLPFAVILGSLLGVLAIGLFHWLGARIAGGYSEDGWFFLYILPVFMSGVFGYLWVTIACAVAPAGKRVTGVVVTTILCMLTGLSAIIAFSNPDFSVGDRVQQVTTGLATIIAAIATVASFEE